MIIPSITYKNPDKAIKWLQKVFGFQEHQVFKEGEEIIHAELSLGNSMIMVSSITGSSPYKKLIVHPSQTNGLVTQSPYIIIENVKEHCDKAKKHGARIALDFTKPNYGGENYSCYDLEGHLWNFGSYDPLKQDIQTLKKEIETIENNWNQAIERNDVTEMEKYICDEWCIVGCGGITKKEQFINSVKNGDLIHTKMDFEIKSIVVNKDSATIAQLGTSEGEFKGKSFSIYEWSTSIFIRHQGTWKVQLTTLVEAMN